MAYVLGFIVADGCICESNIKSEKVFRKKYCLNITSKDKDHLENIKRVMAAEQRITMKGNGLSKKKVYSALQICIPEIYFDLLKLGICPRKSLNLKPIFVPDRYFADFARGFFDGDGTVYIYQVNKTFQIKAGFIGYSRPFLEDFNNKLYAIN